MTLRLFLLDGAQGLILIPFFFLLHVVTTLFIEGTVLYSFKYKAFKRCLTDAFIVNLCSLIIGLFLMNPFQTIARNFDNRDDVTPYTLVLLLLFFIETVLVEGLILRLLNKTYPVKKLVLATLIMNIITYIALYWVLTIID